MKVKFSSAPRALRGVRCGAAYHSYLDNTKTTGKALENEADFWKVDNIKSCANREGFGETRCSRDLPQTAALLGGADDNDDAELVGVCRIVSGASKPERTKKPRGRDSEGARIKPPASSDGFKCVLAYLGAICTSFGFGHLHPRLLRARIESAMMDRWRKYTPLT